MNDQPPEYKVYRSRRGPRSPLGGGGDLENLRARLDRGRRDREPRRSRGLDARRIARWVLTGCAAWIVLSLILFMVSAQLEGRITDDARDELSRGSFFTGATVLVLGSDQRKGASLDQSAAPGRADSIMLIHASFGSVRKLSIPRDTQAEIPGHGTQKINAAYALGGPALQIETVESFLGNGLEINHLMEVDFENFPEFIDAMGGVTVDNPTRICAPEFDNFWRGFNLPKGEQELDGRQALGYARVRQNPCAPSEDDRARAARQQEVLSAMRRSLLRPTTFLRLPWVAWKAPQTIRSDMKGPGLLALAGDIATGGGGETRVLESIGSSGSNLIVAEGDRADAVDELLGR